MDSTSSVNLPGYECQLGENGLTHSKSKLESAANDLISSSSVSISVSNVHQMPCLSHKETVDYRSACAFQIIKTVSDESDDPECESDLCFAMRSKKIAKPLNSDHFPIATPRIQCAMKLVVENLNKRYNVDQGNQIYKSPFVFNQLRTHLCSASFVSSWNDDLDCIATFNYSQPLYSDETSKQKMLSEAGLLCSKCNITTLILRSKKMKEVVGRSPPYIDDVLYLILGDDTIRVDLSCSGDNCPSTIPIYYHKPEDAFQHPNGNTMLLALEWMLNKLKAIGESRTSKPFNLLEMYCGAGAHTMPISKACIFDAIVAVELDQRLVDACKENCIRNGCERGEGLKTEENDETPSPTPIHVFRGDAGEWASKSLSGRLKRLLKNGLEDINYTSKMRWQTEMFQVLLVDPPR